MISPSGRQRKKEQKLLCWRIRSGGRWLSDSRQDVGCTSENGNRCEGALGKGMFISGFGSGAWWHVTFSQTLEQMNLTEIGKVKRVTIDARRVYQILEENI